MKIERSDGKLKIIARNSKDKIYLDLLLHEEQLVTEGLIAVRDTRDKKQLLFVVDTDDGGIKKVDACLGEEIFDEDLLATIDLYFGYLSEWPKGVRPIGLGRGVIAMESDNNGLLILTYDGEEVLPYNATSD